MGLYFISSLKKSFLSLCSLKVHFNKIKQRKRQRKQKIRDHVRYLIEIDPLDWINSVFQCTFHFNPKMEFSMCMQYAICTVHSRFWRIGAVS